MRGQQRIFELPGQSVQDKYSPQPEHHMLSLPDNLLQQGLSLGHFQQALLICSPWTCSSSFPGHTHWSRTQTWAVWIDISSVNPPQQLVERVFQHVAVVVARLWRRPSFLPFLVLAPRRVAEGDYELNIRKEGGGDLAADHHVRDRCLEASSLPGKLRN